MKRRRELGYHDYQVTPRRGKGRSGFRMWVVRERHAKSTQWVQVLQPTVIFETRSD